MDMVALKILVEQLSRRTRECHEAVNISKREEFEMIFNYKRNIDLR